MATQFIFDVLPVLKLDSQNKTGSWKAWLRKFKLSIELISQRLGKENVNGQNLDVFRGRLKVLALLNSIGEDGLDALDSVGCDTMDDNLSYDDVMTHLRNIFGTEETVYVKTHRFVTASQTAGETETDFLLRVEKLSRCLDFGKSDNVRQQFACVIAVNGLRESFLRTQLMEINGLTWKTLSDALRIRKHACESETVISGVKVNAKSFSKEKRKVEYGIHSISLNRSSKRDRSPGSDKDNWRKKDIKTKSSFKSHKKEGCYKCGSISHHIRYCRHAECFNCNSIGHTAMDCTAIKSKRKVRFQSSSKANTGNVMFVGGQSKVAGKLTKTLDVNNCDVQFVCDTGADVSILTEATSDMLSLELRKPDCQLTSADGSDLNVVGVCNVRISKRSHFINADVYVLRGLKNNLLGISELREFAMNNDKVLNCNATVDVGAASMYTNAVSAFSAGTSGKESNAVAFASDFMVTNGKGRTDKGRSHVSNISTDASQRSKELSVGQSVRRLSPVGTLFSIEVSACTQSAKILTFVD